MTDQSGRGRPSDGAPGDSWERRASDLANEIQRWLIRTSARNVRDELGGQIKKAFRGSGGEPGDIWATATTESPHAAEQAPECAWCPICRAARRIADARATAESWAAESFAEGSDAGSDTSAGPASGSRRTGAGDGVDGDAGAGAGERPSSGGPKLSDVADALVVAVRGALSGLDSILSYRPAEDTTSRPGPGRPAEPTATGSAEPSATEPGGDPVDNVADDQAEEPEDDPGHWS